MPASSSLYHAVLAQLKRVTAAQPVRVTSLARLALLVTGIIAARSCVLAQVAHELQALGLSPAQAESIARRLRRTLNDPRLTATQLYRPALAAALDWTSLRRQPLWLVLDESSHSDQLHLLRVSLPYWGHSLPLAWDLWPQNEPYDAYWQTLDEVLEAVASWLPAHDDVRVLADRAYDIPDFLDRVAAHGWHWIVRCKARSALRFRSLQGQEVALAALLEQHLPGPGHRFKARGQVFKKAGWRDASVVAVWAQGQAEPLVLLSDLPPRWALVRDYQRRAWIEPGFRSDKRGGWHWEDSQVQGVAHHRTLLLALAWASLLMLCLGVPGAQHALQQPQRRCLQPHDHPRASLFTLGLRRVRAWLYQSCPVQLDWHLPEVPAPSWNDRWRAAHIHAHLRLSVRP
jgi:hypothetical protein